MNFIKATLLSFASTALDIDDLPANDGKFLYTDVFTNHQGIHMMNLEIGSTHQNMHLWLSTYEKKMSVVKFDSSDSIDVPNKYNPKQSTSAVYVSASSGQEQILNLGEESRTLTALTLTGNEIEDTVTVGFGNDIYTSFRSIFLGVDGSMNQKFAAKVDGFVGLAPYTKETAVIDRSFLYQLKENKYIDHIIFSVYLKMEFGNTTHIKFGGYDEEGIIGGNPYDMQFLKTKSVNTWAVDLMKVEIGNKNSTIGKNRKVLFELAYPYIYVPQLDFIYLAKVINTAYGMDICQETKSKCIINKPCDQIPVLDEYLKLTLNDDTKAVRVHLSRDSMFLPGELQNLGENSCFVPIFGQISSTVDTWFLGDVFMSEYYTVFDMTPMDEHNKDYIRIGIAKANPSDTIGSDLLEKAKRYHESSAKSVFWVIILFVSLIIVASYLCIKQQAESEISIYFQYNGLNQDGLDIYKVES